MPLNVSSAFPDLGRDAPGGKAARAGKAKAGAGKGGARKAVIFTESVRTQLYLRELLELHGYAGRVVLMNGQNGDQQSRETYARWIEKHRGTDKVSGSKSADMKAAFAKAGPVAASFRAAGAKS